MQNPDEEDRTCNALQHAYMIKLKNTTRHTKTSTLTVNLLNIIESIRRIGTASYKRSVTPFWFQFREETITHIVTECKKLAQKEYKGWRHDQIGKCVHWRGLVLITPETGMITSQIHCWIFLFKLTTKLSTTDQTS